jgi:hypothetical protein
MKNQFWAGLGSRAALAQTKFGADYEKLLRPVFLMISNFFENNVGSALKSCIK